MDKCKPLAEGGAGARGVAWGGMEAEAVAGPGMMLYTHYVKMSRIFVADVAGGVGMLRTLVSDAAEGVGIVGGRSGRVSGRGLHSFTSQLNLSRLQHTTPPQTPHSTPSHPVIIL